MPDKTLIYIGANYGFGLERILNSESFDKVYAFEPNPEVFKALKNRYSNNPKVTLINVACSDESGIKTLYITENVVSSSLADVNMENQVSLGGHSGSKPAKYMTGVKCINLKDFIEENEIGDIDLLVTDTQGSDYKILSPLKGLFEERRIKEIFCETHADGVEMYLGLDNSFSKFKELLSPFFHISYFSCDGVFLEVEKEKELKNYLEWDTCWKLN